MAYKTCPDCGSRIFEHGCVNCNEVDYISMQQEATTTHIKDTRVIVAGCRDFTDYELLKAELNILIAPTIIDRQVEIVSGRCNTGVLTFTNKNGIKVYGTDGLGEKYADEYGFKVVPFPANWKLGKSAGPIRNEQMSKYGTHCVCFWDGVSKGTKSMIEFAKKNNLRTEVINIKPNQQ